MYILLMVVLLLVCVIFLTKSDRFRQKMHRILLEMYYEIVYNLIGTKGLIEDFTLRKKNVFDVPKRKGCVAVVTGGARGIGVEIVKTLANAGITTIIGCRKVSAGEDLVKKIQIDLPDADILVCELDVSSLKSVKAFANKVSALYPQINYLINNAGIMFGPYKKSVDGFEWQFAVNYLGHFMLTHLLLPNLKAAGQGGEFNARIVNVSSIAHIPGAIYFDDINSEQEYFPGVAYSQSKLAQILFTYHLNKLLQNEGAHVQVHAVHPGIVNTELLDTSYIKKIIPFFFNFVGKPPYKGATPILYACLSPDLEGKGGNYISNCVLRKPSSEAENPSLQNKMFEFTKDLIDVKQFGGKL